MPVRTYSGIDLINYLFTDNSTHGSNNGTSSASASEVSQAVVNGIGSANDSGIDPAGFANIQYVVSGDFDFDAFPGIPDNASITSIRVKVNNSSSGIASGTSTGGGDLRAVTSAQNVVELPVGNILLGLLVNATDGPNDGPSPSSSANGSINFSTEEELLASPIDKATLVASYGNIAFTISGSASCGDLAGGIVTSATSASSFANLNNFQVIIAYDSGPEVTLTPSGGTVEPGQSITVTSNNIALGGGKYAALQGDKVIPIVPKITKTGPLPTDVIVTIEVPIPATTDCFDCFGDCPECETCFDACSEDLDSETCQECMESCIDCLVECLESEEYAEACIQSTGETPDVPIPIVIIYSDPTQFDGTVPLGNFVVIIANASGIYRLVAGKASDTLYSSARDGTTYNVKIPNPFGKTGFFRS